MSSTKFSIQIENQFGYDWQAIKEIVQKTERFGYHSFYICDHFFLDKSEASDNRPTLDAWTVLTAAAMVTERIKLGTLVTGNNYRNPALLAKIAASLDDISAGRMEFGIGAGWKEVEYEAYGYDFPSVKDRMDMLEEAMQIVLKLFREDRPSFEGKHYSINETVFSPKPKDPLIMIGGGGEKRTLKMVAEYADYCNLFNNLSLTDLNRKLDALKGHCENIGRDYNEVGKSMFIFGMYVTEEQEELDQLIESTASRFGRTTEEIKTFWYPEDMPGGWVGTPEQLRDRIEFMNSLGFDYYFFQQPISLKTKLIDDFATLVKDKYFK